MNPPSHHKNEVNSSMSVDELDEILDSYRDFWITGNPLAGIRTDEAKQAIHQYVTKKQIEALKLVLHDTGGHSDARWTYENVKGRIAQLEKQLKTEEAV